MTAVTIEIPATLDALARSVYTTPKALLESFIRDLCDLPDSNGSDERRAAEAWFDRVVWPLPDDDEPPPCVQEAMRWRG